MVEKGRGYKSIRNIITGLGSKFLILFLAFISRTVFIKLLGAEYNGINSLFTNILSVLSLGELGIGNVLMFYLYSALKNNDKERIKKIIYDFKKIYTIIIVFITVIGLALIPLLQFLVKSEISNIEIIKYYILYLVNSIASYLLVYRTTILSSDQRNYIVSLVQTITTAMMYLFQIAFIYIFENFTVYLLIQIVFTILNNLILNWISIAKYPYLKEKETSIETVHSKKEITNNVKATFLYKLSDTILDQTDSIIISILFGTLIVGFYSNYYLIITYLVSIAGIIANGLLASFGNLNSDNNLEKSYSLFNVALMGFSFIANIFTIGYFCLIDDFVILWLGPEYVVDKYTITAICFVFYLRISTNTMWMYRSSMGLFKEVKYANFVAALLNLILSIVLGMIAGVSGVIIATAISRLLTSFWYEAVVLYKKFNKKVQNYFIIQLKNFLFFLLGLIISYLLCSLIKEASIIYFLIKSIICIIISSVFSFISYFKSDSLKYILNRRKPCNNKDNN